MQLCTVFVLASKAAELFSCEIMSEMHVAQLLLTLPLLWLSHSQN
jgi:hypothetical protein